MANPQMIQFLIDALRQRSMSPEPSYDAMGRPVPRGTPQQPDPSMLGGGIAAQGGNALIQEQLRRQQMMQQME